MKKNTRDYTKPWKCKDPYWTTVFFFMAHLSSRFGNHRQRIKAHWHKFRDWLKSENYCKNSHRRFRLVGRTPCKTETNCTRFKFNAGLRTTFVDVHSFSLIFIDFNMCLDMYLTYHHPPPKEKKHTLLPSITGSSAGGRAHLCSYQRLGSSNRTLEPLDVPRHRNAAGRH